MNSKAYLPFARPALDEETIDGVAEVLRSAWIASGPYVLQFEKALSDYLGGRPVRTLTSATAAMEVALQLLNIGPGDEVITSAHSFFATSNMILKMGAKPVFVDCELSTRNMDLAQATAAITPRSKALLPTHCNTPLDVNAWCELARKRGLHLIEDAALAIGSTQQGKKIGSIGELVSFSFHPNKNMTTIEGGALVLSDETQAKHVEQLRFHGIIRLPDGTRDVDFPGGKFNLSDVSARIGLSQLRQLDHWISKRRMLAQHYFTHLRTEPACMLPPNHEEHSWNMFCVLLPLEQLRISRKQFIDQMHAQGIGVGISYEALHLSTLCRKLGYREGMFPNAERIARETVSLPLFPSMDLVDVERVCEAAREIIDREKK